MLQFRFVSKSLTPPGSNPYSVTGSMVAYNFSISKDGPFSKKLNIVATMFFTSVFLTNIIVTCLTAWKIWRFRRRTDLGNSKDYAGALNIVVESGELTISIHPD